jgi:hypothetical protein
MSLVFGFRIGGNLPAGNDDTTDCLLCVSVLVDMAMTELVDDA